MKREPTEIRDPANDARLIAYFQRAAAYRSADQAEFAWRHTRGRVIQRDLYRKRPGGLASIPYVHTAPSNVVQMRRAA